ncbi:dihydroxyacetone kinase [Sporothrix brasiliensis 5110]|uniref:Dihydroxyacetone kinase n=1 Tax=Sporothrix brasiliensis 5110 TaxID=1398154 RepID=A0A0C2ISZ0_9PEZI|nr:dihydroxyacetone kinase [Sporothrix brasiliensis 5110]KIH92141.1 dihydroxyacetone kinase [Sporothrix brasiliensis 5110]
MSTAHLFNSADGLVVKALRGLVAYNPNLALDADLRVVYDTAYDRSKVAIISGGGSGHEPAWAGYVGTNMLAAAACGDIFASPSTRQILSAVNRVPSDAGTILVITNYTGDCLHFGLAAEKANASGQHTCRMIVCGDDVSVGRGGGRLVGRRGLAGQIAVLKIMGAASATAAHASLDDVYGLGQAVAKQLVSIAATLDHCHVPGRTEHGALAADEIEIGTGPHNEPGYRTLQPAPSAEDLVANLLRHCLDETDAERAYVHFATATEEGTTSDEVVLLVSNFGGMSQLELSALVDELLVQLQRDWAIVPVRVYAGSLETSLNAPAFSVSLLNLTAAAADPQNPYSVDALKSFLDTRTSTYWESFAGAQAQRRPRAEQFVPSLDDDEHKESSTVHGGGGDLPVDAARLERALRRACRDLAAAEPDLTRWDTVMGDGDCGETLKTGALALLAAVDGVDGAAPLAQAGSSVAVLRALEHIVETKMGGTLGGILGIFLVSLCAAVEKAASDSVKDTEVWGHALTTAIDHLGHYTPAKVGDRTVMDTLIPFAQTIGQGGFAAGVAAAEKGAESTRKLTPKLGRATYVGAGKDASSDLPPDPGAWGIMVAIKGLYDGWQGEA